MLETSFSRILHAKYVFRVRFYCQEVKGIHAGKNRVSCISYGFGSADEGPSKSRTVPLESILIIGLVLHYTYSSNLTQTLDTAQLRNTQEYCTNQSLKRR